MHSILTDPLSSCEKCVMTKAICLTTVSVGLTGRCALNWSKHF